MTFSAGFLSFLVYLSLAWCAVSAVGLISMLVRDLMRGETW